MKNWVKDKYEYVFFILYKVSGIKNEAFSIFYPTFWMGFTLALFFSNLYFLLLIFIPELTLQKYVQYILEAIFFFPAALTGCLRIKIYKNNLLLSAVIRVLK